ncbi:hypothetical protein EJB05_44241 [Eragrostis curvula]|uniref:Uncharacterized protein n=1 Tax=Eragrostis curvula TaxID=38414 RepID=A0A5J9THJ0_9POAL|nr:hypothetical protein EJB05_44241 [Eragrostis curvula]
MRFASPPWKALRGSEQINSAPLSSGEDSPAPMLECPAELPILLSSATSCDSGLSGPSGAAVGISLCSLIQELVCACFHGGFLRSARAMLDEMHVRR